VELDLSELERGHWWIRLDIEPAGGDALSVEREIEIRGSPQG
jgi:hypothetical protein